MCYVNVAKGYKQEPVTQHKVGYRKGSEVLVCALIEGRASSEIKRMYDV